MHSVTPVKITLPDGIERELRSTLGAKKKIVDLLGVPLIDALNKYDSGAFPAILFAFLHDENGNPTVSLGWLESNLIDSDSAELMAAIMCAASQGKQSKNELEAQFTKAIEIESARLMARITGSTFSASQLSASDSAEPNSGGDTLSVRSQHE